MRAKAPHPTGRSERFALGLALCVLISCSGTDEDFAEVDPVATADVDPWANTELPQEQTKDGSQNPTPTDAPELPPAGSETQIVSVTPDHGPTSGLTEVVLLGVGFNEVEAVLFAESPAVDFEIIDDHTVRARAPPRPAGLVDVSVRLDDDEATVIKLPLAFRYEAQVSVHKVEPDHGSALGGEVVTITGTGFSAKTSYVFGHRLAIDPLVVDEFTAIVRTPPGIPGRVAVAAASDDGTAILNEAYQYTSQPRIDFVMPAVVPLGGGIELTLYGAGLVSQSAIVRILTPDGDKPAPVSAAAKDGAWLRIVAPKLADPGLFDVRYTNPWGSSTLKDAIHYAGYIDPATGKTPKSQLIHILPASAPVNQQRDVLLYLIGPIATQAVGEVSVRFGTRKVKVINAAVGPGLGSGVGGTIHVRTTTNTPWPAAGKVTVKVSVGGHSIKAPKAFQWLPAQASILKVQPEQIDAAGGSSISVQLGPSSAALGAIGSLRVGALLASNLQTSTPDADGNVTITALAPKGSPGLADVRAAFVSGQELVAAKAVEYTAQPFLAAIVPGRGAQAGGTLVHVVGGGLDKLKHLGIGGVIAGQWELADAGLVHLRTPPGEPGPADLVGTFADDLKQTLAKAFVYFDPLAGNMGTWGPPIDGAVNVTVMQSNMGGGPVEGALVVIGNEPSTPYKGTTDARGQITFSDIDLSGPLMVSAAKSGYTAASVVTVNSENITMRVRKLVKPPPSQGIGGAKPEEDPFPDGIVEGVVINAGKYAPLPPGSCKNQPGASGHCAPCQVDSQCYGSLTCEQLDGPTASIDPSPGGGDVGGADPPAEATETWASQKHCAAPCLADDQCPPAYECRAIGWSPGSTKYRCAPKIGKAEVRCETSSPSMFGGNPSPGPGAVADAQHKFNILARPGDLAVACTAGYIDAMTGKFIPLVMGIKRAITVAPGATTSGVKVFLNIPLTRRVRVRLDRVPMGPDAANHQRFLYSALALGAEGYLPMADVETTHLTDTLVLERQPASLKGPHSDIGYDMYAGIRSPLGGAPTAIAVVEGLFPDKTDHYVWWPNGEKKPVASAGMALPINDVAQASGLVVAVGDHGHIGVWGGKSFTAQASPTTADLEAIWLLSAEHGLAGGEGGVLLSFDPVEGWKKAPAPTAKRIVDISGRAKDDVWMLTADNQLQHYNGKTWLTVTGPWPAPVADPNSWPKTSPARLRAIWQAPTGELMLAGDGGGLVRGKAKAGGGLTFETVSSGTSATIRAIWGFAATDYWLAGDRGLLAHQAADQAVVMKTGVTATLNAVVGNGTGVHAVGGGGAWVQMDLQGTMHDRSIKNVAVDLKGIADAPGAMVAAGQPMLVMGPYVEMPYITQPVSSAKIGNVIEWKAAPGVTPTLNMVRIASYNYTTLWEIFVKGSVTKVTLPIFTQMGGNAPLPPGQLRVRVWRINAPQLSIDHFSHKQLSIWRWVSYAYNWIMTEQPKHPGASWGLSDEPKLPPPP